MSDVGKLKRSGGTVFPSVRKSADPFQQEQGEMDFSEKMVEFEVHQATSVAETDKAEEAVIHEEGRRHQFRQRKKKKKKEELEEEEAKNLLAGEEEFLIDLIA